MVWLACYCSGLVIDLQLLSVSAGEDACRLIEGTAIGGIQHEPQAPAPNTALAIYQYGKAATDLLDASPIRFLLEVDTRGHTLAPALSVETTQLAPDVPEKVVDKEGIGAGLEGLEKRWAIPEVGESTGSAEWGFMARYPQSCADPKGEKVKESEALSRESPSPEPEIAPPPPKNTQSHSHHELQQREFQLTISRSHLNHQAYIERQAYYGSFNPDMRSIMAEDLESRVPLKGLADCKLGKEEVPLRIRQRRKEKDAERGWVGLKELWEIGRREKQRLETPVE